MKTKTIAGAALFVSISGAAFLSAQSAVKKDYPIQPVPFTRVTVSDDFWLPRIETNRTVTIPFIMKKNEETGRVDNFAIAGGLMKGQYKGERYNDTDVYKVIEGAAYSLQVHPDPELDKYLDGLVAKIAAAQEPDGYLFTARTTDPAHPQPGIGPERWVEETVSHELYNAGHLYEAAVAHFQATGKRTLLDVALKNADLVASVFGPDKRHGFPGHQEIELALVKLYRVTGDEKYLNLAKYFLDQRGHDVKLTQYPPGNRFSIYNDAEQIQAHKLIFEQSEAVGHAVRAAYMFTGMADVAALTGDAKYLAAIEKLWDNVINRKMYLTGGIGARHDRERFGADYELPNLTAYAETCASIGMAFWNHRMFLLTGDAKYLDVMERVIYNGVISGVSLDGDAFFYANPLESDGKFRFNQGRLGRAPYFGTACCPGNIGRFLPSFPGYIYAVKDDSVYVNLFVGSSAKIDLRGNPVLIKQETRYPWDGAVKISLEPGRAGEFSVFVRMPGWAQNKPVPGDLYRQAQTCDQKIELEVNGRPVDINRDKGFARLRRAWKKGDTITIVFPMDPRRIAAHEALKDAAGKIAVERGPLVYCAEGLDNGGRVLNLQLPDTAALIPEWRPDLLKGVVIIKGKALASAKNADGSAGSRKEQDFLAIPYFAWSHRGTGEMAVWIPRK
jgi:uncharacterized protein